jgi:hypothetical protein
MSIDQTCYARGVKKGKRKKEKQNTLPKVIGVGRVFCSATIQKSSPAT